MKSDNKKYLEMMEEMMEIASYYVLAKRTLLIQEGMLASDDKDAFNPYYQFIDKVNTSFLKLENIYKEIIINEFFSPEDKFWWRLYYKESTFINYKYKAMKEFLEVYHESF